MLSAECCVPVLVLVLVLSYEQTKSKNIEPPEGGPLNLQCRKAPEVFSQHSIRSTLRRS